MLQNLMPLFHSKKIPPSFFLTCVLMLAWCWTPRQRLLIPLIPKETTQLRTYFQLHSGSLQTNNPIISFWPAGQRLANSILLWSTSATPYIWPQQRLFSFTDKNSCEWCKPSSSLLPNTQSTLRSANVCAQMKSNTKPGEGAWTKTETNREQGLSLEIATTQRSWSTQNGCTAPSHSTDDGQIDRHS